MYLDFAERQVKLGHIISMQEWKEKLEMFLNLNEYNILTDNGKIKREIADKLALDEYKNIVSYKTEGIYRILMN